MAPQLDHYVGRTITKVEVRDTEFTIVLDGNKQIHIKGDDAPTRLEKGMEFVSVQEFGDERELRFHHEGNEQSVIVEQGDYAISDEEYPQKRYNPAEDVATPPPPDPSALRDKGKSTRVES